MFFHLKLSGIERSRRAESIPQFSAHEGTTQAEGSLAQRTKTFQTYFLILLKKFARAAGARFFRRRPRRQFFRVFFRVSQTTCTDRKGNVRDAPTPNARTAENEPRETKRKKKRPGVDATTYRKRTQFSFGLCELFGTLFTEQKQFGNGSKRKPNQQTKCLAAKALTCDGHLGREENVFSPETFRNRKITAS